MSKEKVSLTSLKKRKKEGKKLRMITAYDYQMASLVNKSDIELILVGDSLGMTELGYDETVSVTMEDMIHHIKPVVDGAPDTVIVGDLPFGTFNQGPKQAVKNATRHMKEGECDCVKLEGGRGVAEEVEAIVNAGIPVMAHIGLTPQTTSQLGGFKVQGKDIKTAKKLVEDAKILEEAGAFSIVLEAIPKSLAKLISEELEIPTIGIGAGPYCDGQVLVVNDMLGMFEQFVPKFVKQYANLSKDIQEAFNKYAKEVQENEFPKDEHSFHMDEEVLEKIKEDLN